MCFSRVQGISKNLTTDEVLFEEKALKWEAWEPVSTKHDPAHSHEAVTATRTFCHSDSG